MSFVMNLRSLGVGGIIIARRKAGQSWRRGRLEYLGIIGLFVLHCLVQMRAGTWII
jgi:hypothetical protein